MTKAVLLFLSAILLASMLQAQQRFMFSLNPGVHVYNAENSMKAVGDKALRWFPGFSVAYDVDSLWGLDMRVEYCYARSILDNAMPYSTYYGADLTFSTHNIDLAVRTKLGESVTLAVGPTISLVHRTIETTIPAIGAYPGVDLKDRLASLCLGANGSMSIRLPLQEKPEQLFFLTDLKLRYLHSVWFDKRGRNVGGYYQSFIVGYVGFGLGYAF